MAHAAGDAHEFVIYGAHFRVTAPLMDADGDLVTAATTPDSEISQDGGTFADCANEMTELATSSGVYYLDLIGTETDCKQLAVIFKTATAGAKTTPIVLYPNRLPILESGVAQAGAATTITLANGASTKDDFYNGCYVHITDNDAAGSQYQVRKIIDYVGSTLVATIDSAWGTNPGSSSNYDILVPPGMAVVQWAGGRIADPTTAGVPETDTVLWLGSAPDTLSSGKVQVNVQATAGALTFNLTGSITGNLSGSVGSVTGSVGSVTGAVGSVTGNVGGSVASVTAGVTVTTNNDKTGYSLSTTPPTSAQIATAVWQDATAGDFTVASSIGKALYIANVAPGAAGGHLIAGSNAATTFATLTSTGAFSINGVSNVAQTGDSFARIGATGSSLTSLASASTALSTAQWTNTRAGHLDFLNIGGNVASQADVQAINQGASRRIILTAVPSFVLPDSGSVAYTVELRTYDVSGNLTAATGTPTITATGIVSGDLSGHLSAVSNPTTGVYRSTYTVQSTDTIEQIRLDGSAVVGGSTFPATFYTQVSDAAAVDFTAQDRAKLDTLHDTRIPGVVQPQTGDAYARLGAPAGASVSADVAVVTGRLPAALVGGKMDASVGSLGTDAVTAAAFSQAAADKVWATAARTLTAFSFSVTVGTNSDKTGYALTAAYDDAKTAAQAGDAMTLDLTQAVPTTNTANTTGDCFNAARAQGFGKWARVGTAFTLYAPNGTTVVRTFALDDADNPTSRT